MEQVTTEELEALQAKVVEYESILQKNHEDEKTLQELKEQTAALEAQKTAGETRGK
ncbi:MAG: hypothetical protein II625_01415 [Bacilli bacterium]|nr:hypothetical protein [Bacilli bacterium]